MFKCCFYRFFGLVVLFSIVHVAAAQQLTVKDFAIWGGSSPATSYNARQGVFISSKAVINGAVGSNHQINASTGIAIKGKIVSGNTLSFSNLTLVEGDISAGKLASNFSGTLVNFGAGTLLKGNLISYGKVEFKLLKGYDASAVTGKVVVPAPTQTNYIGPAPKGGFSNVLQFPLLPVMPDNTPFDTKYGTINITASKIITPGAYRTLALTGSKSVTFSGPGNYIFYNVNNSGNSNEFIFDFKGTATGTINIYVVNDANLGKLSSRMINGNFPSRIYTEVHGNGSTNSGNAFNVGDGSAASAVTGTYNWIGTVWAPNGGINVGATSNSNKGFINISGALWSGTKVSVATGVSVVYQATAVEQNFIKPYYPPPASGKVTATNNIIGAELLSLNQNTNTITAIPNNSIYRIVNNSVLIEVISKVPNDATLLNQLVAAGMTGVINNGPDAYVITGYFPIANLTTLNSNARIVYVRPSYPPIANAGQVTSQGDSTMRSNNVRSRFGLDGEGVKVGVLSDSYNAKGGAQHDVDEDDLPGIKSNGQLNANSVPVQVLQDLTGKNDEGRAMLQIVHDVAPKAKLAFSTGFLTAGNFAASIKALADPNLPGGRCDILVDDITYITEPFLQDGVVAKTVDSVVAKGVTYFSSAGNFGNRSYENMFQGISNTALFPAPATIHKFGATNADIYQTLHLKPGSYTIVLQWSDEFSSLGSVQGVQTDLDLYLVNSTGFTLFGFNRSNLFGDPFEVCPFTITDETEAKLMIVNATGSNNTTRFKYIIFGGDGTIVDYQTGGSTVVGHANADSAIAVGAMLYANIPQYTPVYPAVASFSSRGGTYTLNSSNNTYTPRQKPDLIAPNGVNTTVNLGGPVFDDGDPYPNFFGTSAAAPHAAAAGALLLQAKKKYGLQANVAPVEIRNGLQNSAGRLVNQTVVPSFTEGYGYVQADSAVQQIANARPIINSWEPVVTGTQPGSLPFQVKVKGAYLTPGSVIYFNAKPLTTAVSPDKTEALATVPPIANGDDPPLQIFNAAKSPSGLDGGMSEALHFFSARVDVTIKAQNISRKFGQQNPSFGSQIFVNGVPIENTNLTLTDLKLDGNNISYSTLANPESSAGLYSITPLRSTPLNPNDPLLSAYGFTFVTGTLSIDKMPLKITPRNQTIKYGEYPGEVVFDYELNHGATVDSTLLNQVQALHKKYLANNALVVLNGFENMPATLNDSDLANTSLLASFQAIRNARQLSLNNGQLQAVVNTVSTDSIGQLRYLVDVSAQSLANYKLNAAQSNMVTGWQGEKARALLNIKSLANGSAKAAVPNGQLQPVVNGQLLAMVNGQLQAVVNGQLQAVVNGVSVTAADIIFQNGQLLALVNGQWVVATNGQLQAVVNGQNVSVDLAVVNGQLQAVVNGQLMAVVNGQLQAVVKGQLLAVVNGQLQAVVNGQLMPVVNGQLLAVVNGQLQAVVNGQLMAVVNGQLLAVVNGELDIVESLTYLNGQLQAVVNGQLQAVVNGQLKAMVNGIVTDVPNPTLVNGQLQAIVNGQLQAVVNGQLQAVVNGQLQPVVNGDLIPVSGVRQLSNGQLRAVVNGTDIPLKNGQLQAVVNGQLLAVVNGQLMAVVNGELTFAVMQNGQLQALVNGQLLPVVNGQLQPVVNGQLQPLVNVQLFAVINNQLTTVDNYTISNGQLQAVVNGQSMMLVNNQLLAFSNGQLQPVVNNFDVSGTNNNAKTMVLVDEDDINLQGGSVGGMFSVNMITGLNAGKHKLCAGAFIDENFEVSYGVGEITILPRPLVVKGDSVSKIYGSQNPPLTISGFGFGYNESLNNITAPDISVTATTASSAGQYPITLSGGSSTNYSLIVQNGILTILKKTLTVTADNQMKGAGQVNPPLTVSYNGLVNGDTKDSFSLLQAPVLPKNIYQLERTATYTNVMLNGGSNTLRVAPGAAVSLTADWSSIVKGGTLYCPGCITQNYIGIAGVFSDCHDVSGLSLVSGAISTSFTAPATPGIYYITQLASWEYGCYNNGTGVNFDNNNANDAIAVLEVKRDTACNSIFVSTVADALSPAGSYPITLTGCNLANYYVTYVNGMLSVNSLPLTAITNKSTIVTQEESTVNPYVAPNPARNTIKVQIRDEVISFNNLLIMDELGRKQAVKNIKRLSGSLFEIDISALPKGVYFIKVTTVRNEQTFKFLKL